MRWAHAAVVLLAIGCVPPAETIGRGFTGGALEALRPPELEDPLLLKARTLLERYVDAGLAGETDEALGEALADVVSTVLRETLKQVPELSEVAGEVSARIAARLVAGLRAELPALRAELRAASAAVGSGLLEGGLRHRETVVALLREATGAVVEGAVSDASGALSEALAPGAGAPLPAALATAIESVVLELLGSDGEGPAAQALAATARRLVAASISGAAGDGGAGWEAAAERLAERLTAGIVRGAMAELFPASGEGPGLCPGADRQCMEDLVYAFSKAVGRGFTEGVGRETSPWYFVLAAAGGLLFGLLLAVLLAVLLLRRYERPPRSEPTPRS